MRPVILLFLTALLEAAPQSPPTSSPDEPLPTDASLPSSPAPLGARVQGVVREAGTRTPLEGAEIRIAPGDLEVYSSEKGEFELPSLTPGSYTLTILVPGYASKSLPLLVQGGEDLELDVFLFPALKDARPFAMTVETQKAGEDVTRYALDPRAATRTPGSLGDPVRTVQNLPGVARAPYGLGTLIIRGAAPYESGYFLEGSEIPLLFHFLGLTSAVGADLVDAIDYLPGGFGARYGRLVGGLVELKLKEDLSGPTHGHVGVDLINSSVHVRGQAGEGALGQRVNYAVAARTSYLEAVLAPIAEDILQYPLRAAHFRDAQLRLNARVTDRTRVSLTLMTSEDRFLLLNQESSNAAEGVDPEALAEYQADFGRIHLQLKTRFHLPLTHRLVVAAGPNHEYLAYGNTQVTYRPFTWTVRDEWEWQVNSTLFMRTGLDAQATLHAFQLDLPGSTSDVPTEQEGWGFAPAPFVELEWSPLPHWRFQPGLRLDFLWNPSQDYAARSVDPRFSARRKVPLPARTGTVLNGSQSLELQFSAGKYSQPPDASEYFAEYGNNRLLPYSALQLGMGATYRLEPGYQAQLALFYNDLQSLVYLPEPTPIPIEDYLLGATDTDVTLPRPQNGGAGRSYGLELLLKLPETGRLTGWVSYALSRSERLFPGQQVWSPTEYEQPHLLSVVSSYQLPGGWSLGGRFRLGSGSPYTPVANRLQNVDTGGVVGLDDPTRGDNWARLPPYHTLDIRLDKEWRYQRWLLLASLEVQNVYYRQNVELVYANRDYSGEIPIYGLPILPVLGIRGEF